MTEATHGNAIGIGKADFITRRMYEKIDLGPTYINAVTGGAPEAGRIAMICDHDKQALVFAMTTIGDKDEKNVRLMWIANTLELEEVLISEAMLPDVKANKNLQVVGGPFEIKFKDDGYVEEFFSKRVPGAAH